MVVISTGKRGFSILFLTYYVDRGSVDAFGVTHFQVIFFCSYRNHMLSYFRGSKLQMSKKFAMA